MDVNHVNPRRLFSPPRNVFLDLFETDHAVIISCPGVIKGTFLDFLSPSGRGEGR